MNNIPLNSLVSFFYDAKSNERFFIGKITEYGSSFALGSSEEAKELEYKRSLNAILFSDSVYISSIAENIGEFTYSKAIDLLHQDNDSFITFLLQKEFKGKTI